MPPFAPQTTAGCGQQGQSGNSSQVLQVQLYDSAHHLMAAAAHHLTGAAALHAAPPDSATAPAREGCHQGCRQSSPAGRDRALFVTPALLLLHTKTWSPPVCQTNTGQLVPNMVCKTTGTQQPQQTGCFPTVATMAAAGPSWIASPDIKLSGLRQPCSSLCQVPRHQSMPGTQQKLSASSSADQDARRGGHVVCGAGRLRPVHLQALPSAWAWDRGGHRGQVTLTPTQHSCGRLRDRGWLHLIVFLEGGQGGP